MSHNNKRYDVKNFTDDELFVMMDLNHPTDRELEAKIYSLIDEYGSENTDSSKQMHIFFTDVFHHFFHNYEDDKEGYQNMNNNDAKSTQQTQPTQSTQTQPTQPLSTITSNYSKGLLNPLLKDTIKRIVCIDSQYRDLSIYPNSSNFTFNL